MSDSELVGHLGVPNAIYGRLHPQEWEVEIDGKEYIFPRHDTAVNNIETSLLKRRNAQFPNRSGDNGVAERIGN